ncbi:MAG: chloride channel protein [Deltaproteobacteria bacterium]|nr:chloride channel protein [Deltaproteobacteria bacterium]
MPSPNNGISSIPEMEGQPGTRRLHRTSAREAALLMVLAVFVGLASGVSAVILSKAVHYATTLMVLLQGNAWIMLVPAAGAGLSALFLHSLLRDSSGHGVPELIRAAAFGGGRVRRDMIFSRLISSFLTVGSGGSAGLEGPIAVSGGAIGSSIGSLLRFNERRRTLLLGYGVAGAVAAIFNAPLTGTVFALEVILGEWSALSILPTIVSAVSATQFSRLILGNQSAFSHGLISFHTWDLLVVVALGVGTGLLSVLFQHGLRLVEVHARQAVPRVWIRATLGGLLVGTTGYFMPDVLHDGYLVIQKFLFEEVSVSLMGVFLFVMLKFMASCFTLGSGGSGGVFAPSLVLGSASGFGFGHLMRTMFPMVEWSSASAFALVGMAGMVAGLMHAPLTGMFLVLEITGSYGLVLPLMLVSVIAMLISYFFEEGSVYTRELISRGELAKRGSDQHLLQTMAPRELVDKEDITLAEDMLLGQFVHIFKRAKRNVFPVVDPNSRTWLGVVYLDDLRPYLFDQAMYPIMTMGSVMHSDLPIIAADESALDAIQKFESSGAWSLPVIDKGRFLGMMSKSTLFDRYRRELIVHTTE